MRMADADGDRDPLFVVLLSGGGYHIMVSWTFY